jgi:predicted ATPase/DNA-binding SARP family transcriptional activator
MVAADHSAIEIRLLGPVEAVADQRVLALGGRRQRALLALLSLEVGRPVPADRLAEELWLGAPPAGAEATLRTYVSRLRRALGQDAVQAEAGGYALAVDPDRFDVRRFERLERQGREALAAGAAGVAAERLQAALAFWRGNALADVCDGGALAAEALRLDELRLVALEERIEADLALGRHAALVPELQARILDQPLRERLRRQLVLALYRCGRQAEALAAYGDARRLLREELGLEPGEELKALERAILRQEVEPVAPVESRHNLPAPTTSFVGRERELAELERLLRDRRLVTLTGMGGSGKTRLALEAVRTRTDAWAGGVWLVDLTALADGELVPAAVAATVGADPAADRPLEALLEHIGARELLLLLDNCEHLAAACAELADALLRACPNVRILATSRVPLAVQGELDFALDPLAAPGEEISGEEVERSPSVRLFVERASAVRRDVASGAEELATIARICRVLDGLPLAIELAAVRAKALSLGEIAARLDDRFRFLRAWQRVADPRHRTLQTAMDWSYDLLGESERGLLDRLSVFADDATLEAISDICLEGDDEGAVELLGRLVDASLVRTVGGEPMGYRLLETVRQYAAAKLAADPDAGAVRRRHAEHYARLAESANLSIESLGRGPQRQQLVLRVQHNIRAALDWAAAADVELALRLMLALENFWITQAPIEGARRYEQLLAHVDEIDVLLRARATRDYAACLDVLRDLPRAREEYERSGELSRVAGDEVGVATATFRLGVVAYMENDVARTRRLWEESLRVFRSLDDKIGELQVLGNLGGLELKSGDSERGRAMLDAAVEMAREAGWHWWLARAVGADAADAAAAGRADEAEQKGREFLSISWRIGNRQEVVRALAILARAAALRGDDERALALWASVEAVEDSTSRFGRFDRSEYAACMPQLPRPAPLPLADAVTLALSN